MILGIDEVGRGPWAGPLVMGACILHDNPREEWQDSLTDSKKLTAKRREELAPVILEGAAAVGLGWVSAGELDNLGMTKALRLACRRAVEKVQESHVPFTEIIIDGTVNFLEDTALEKYVSTLKKADLLIKEVSAASIVAKVKRDQYMIDVAKKYPEYGFEKHVGYGTKLHRERLMQYGVCPEHRRSFRPVANVLSQDVSVKRKMEHGDSTTDIGQIAESIVADYLITNGHKVIARNYKTKTYEIDIISILGDVVYFTEVKYRKDETHGSPLEMIGQKKLQQMRYAAEAFMHQKRGFVQNLRPKLAVASVIGGKYKFDTWFPLEAE